MKRKPSKGAYRVALDALGGEIAIAEATAQPLGRVKMWRFRDSIPAGYWLAIVGLAERSGVPDVTLDRFARYAASKVTRAKARPKRIVAAVDNGGDRHNEPHTLDQA